MSLFGNASPNISDSFYQTYGKIFNQKIFNNFVGVDSSKAVNVTGVETFIELLVSSNITSGLQASRNAAGAISMVQTFHNATETIGGKIAEMLEITEKADSGLYSTEQIQILQEEFDELATEINDVATETQYQDNKLLSIDGDPIYVSIGNGSFVKIDTEDLTINVSDVDLTDSDSIAGATTLLNAKAGTTEGYKVKLTERVNRLQSLTAIIEFEVENVTGSDTQMSNYDLALEIAKETAGMIKASTEMALLNQRGNNQDLFAAMISSLLVDG